MQLIIQPCGSSLAQEHYTETMDKGIDYKTIIPYIELDQAKKLVYLAKEQLVYAWGVKPGQKNRNVNYWKKINKGDLCLFAADGRYYSKSQIIFKLHAPRLALMLWGIDGEDLWEYMYFVSKPTLIDVSYKRLNDLVDYNENFFPRGFGIIREDKSAKVVAANVGI